MKRIDWKQLWHSAKRSITHFPVELILAIFGSFVLIVEPFGDYSMPEVSTIFMLGLSIVWAYLLNQFTKNNRGRLLYYLMIPVGVLSQFSFCEPFFDSIAYLVTWLIGVCGLFIAYRTQNNRHFASYILYLLMDIFLATLASVVLYWAINAIYNSIGWIFQIELFYEFKRRFREVLFDLSCPFFVTLLFCVLRENRNPDKMVSGSHFLNIMLNFILTPALMLFTVIVYIYIFKLFFDWELPEDGIPYPILGVVLAAFLLRAFQSILDNHPFRLFYKYLSYILIGPMLLFWVNFFNQIGLNGYNQVAVYELVVGAWLSFSMVLFVVSSTINYRFIFLFGLVSLAAFTYIPPISAKRLGILGERAELQERLEPYLIYNGDGQVVELENDSLLTPNYQKALALVQSLTEETDTLWLERFAGMAPTEFYELIRNSYDNRNNVKEYSYDWHETYVAKGSVSAVMIKPFIKIDGEEQLIMAFTPNQDTVWIDYFKYVSETCFVDSIDGVRNADYFIVNQNDTLCLINSIKIEDDEITYIDLNLVILP